jgi:tRNA-2-methylthio-N6-dimethylallyladenosine synthase
MSKKVFIRTLGCQMNVRDSEVIVGLLKKEGFAIADSADQADIVILNTCSVRQHAEDKVWSEVGRIAKRSPLDPAARGRRIKTGGTPRPTKIIVGLVGCMAQSYKEKIFERSPSVDFVVGPADIDKIPEILAKVTKSQSHKDTSRPLYETKIWETDGEVRPDEIYHTGYYEDRKHAYVVISEGCSNFCSYCVVPFARGPLRNRDHEDILREINEAVDTGITKITLLGQNVNAYKTQVDFVRLLGLVNDIQGIKEFSFITSHPRDTTVELFRAMAELEKLKKYLHLPAQSGSNRILKAMNRGYTREMYLQLADMYRKMVPGGALTTDIIVGYPTETEVDFEASRDLVEQAQFNAAFIFKYSVRPHTEAASIPDDVPKEEKERRHKVILELQKEISKKKK